MKFCCERFEHQLSLDREIGLNIRVVKIEEDSHIDTKKRYRFFITPGYKVGDRAVAAYNIAYCPFCGTNLFAFYKADIYINETNHDFLYP